jgi:hypothetical protein
MKVCDNCGDVRAQAHSAEVHVRVFENRVGRMEVEAYPELCGNCMAKFTRTLARTVNQFSRSALSLEQVRPCRSTTSTHEQDAEDDEEIEECQS